ncbi:NAD-dependent epimerase [Novispirillum sp. DQ9]|uniref:NAD-dependent epimerase n=1 Tax=Novispirillum sp. DQ9 TaxID=3398612 RepID=UPI003C7E3523
MTILVTGSAGFIGSHTAQRLLDRGETVVGVDVVNDYYDVTLKEDRLKRLRANDRFIEARIDIADRAALEAVFAEHRPTRVVNLAAQAGVRYSVENPAAYVQANLVGFANVLECCRQGGVEHLVYASTSSVYGANSAMPFTEGDGVAHPMSLYAATKRANEVMAHSYSHLFSLPTTGLRFFTVYGPWGRPDMALFKFTKAILEGRPIDVYNNGDMQRDFTYIDDIVEGVVRLLFHTAQANPDWRPDERHPDPASSGIAPFRVYNIGRGKPVQLMEYVRTLEAKLGRTAQINLMPMQAGDVSATFADTSALRDAVGYQPATSVEEGVGRFVDWYLSYYSR